MDFIIGKTMNLIERGKEIINQYTSNEEINIQTPDGSNENDLNENIIYEGDLGGKCELDDEALKLLNEKGEKSTCNIINDKNGLNGTGFFCKIKYYGKTIKVLFANYHILNYESIQNGNKIQLLYQDKIKIIEITNERKFWTNIPYDFTCIEIFDSDNIEDFFEIENYKINNYDNDDIAIIQYSNDRKRKIKTGNIYKIENNYEIFHNINTEKGCFGSPIILLLRDYKIIGMHKTYSRKKKKNLGINIKNMIDFIKISSIIGCEFDIKKENLNNEVQILNSEKKNFFIKILSENLENYCDLYINNKKIQFCKKYKFDKEGKYKINILSRKLLTDMSYMFSECIYLSSLDLSNFITNNVTNMKYLLFNCNSLVSLNLSNFNTINVTNMNSMFSGCYSLTSINLSSFNTNNVKDMESMFAYCSSLNTLNLSNFITINVTNMKYMFKECCSLIELDLDNFSTINVKDIEGIFEGINSKCMLNCNDQKIKSEFQFYD